MSAKTEADDLLADFTETKTQAEIDSFVDDLSKTKGEVSILRLRDQVTIRTRDGDTHRFKVAKPAPKNAA